MTGSDRLSALNYQCEACSVSLLCISAGKDHLTLVPVHMMHMVMRVMQWADLDHVRAERFSQS